MHGQTLIKKTKKKSNQKIFRAQKVSQLIKY